MRRGQISMFIIIGIVLVLTVTVLITITGTQNEPSQEQYFTPVFSHIEFCVEQAVREGEQSMYSEKIITGGPMTFGDIYGLKLVDQEQRFILPPDQLEDTLAQEISASLDQACLDNPYETQGFNYSIGDVESVIIRPEQVVVGFQQTTVTHSDGSRETRELSTTLDSEMFSVYRFLYHYSQQEAQVPEGFNIGALYGLSTLYEVQYNISYAINDRVYTDLYVQNEPVVRFGVIHE